MMGGGGCSFLRGRECVFRPLGGASNRGRTEGNGVSEAGRELRKAPHK